MKIEICTNHEWWRVFGPLGIEMDADLVNEYVGKVWRALENANHEVEGARGQRIMCHGWNGANTFQRMDGGIGTFDVVSDAKWAAVEAIVDAVPLPIVD